MTQDRRIYITDLNGRTLVFNHGDQPKHLALNPLDDSFAATPALVGQELFLRGREFLYCIAKGETSIVPPKNVRRGVVMNGCEVGQ